MKKTLALLLAMLLLASTALVSCDKEKETPDETPTDSSFDLNFGDENDDTTPDESVGTDASGNIVTPDAPQGFEVANGTYYLLANVKVRKNATKSSKTNGAIKFGTAVTNPETDGDYYRISYTDVESNQPKIGYVLAEVLTQSKDAVTIKELEEAKETTVTGLGKYEDGKPVGLAVRTTPWKSSGYYINENSNILTDIKAGKLAAPITDGHKVKVIGETADGNWAYIEVVVEIKKSATETEEKTLKGYCFTEYLEAYASSGNNTSGGNTSGGNDADIFI